MRRLLISVGTLLLAFNGACKRLEFHLPKKAKDSSEFSAAESTSPDLTQKIQSAKTPQDYIDQLNLIKSDGASAVFKLYRSNGRTYVRQSMRNFRDSTRMASSASQLFFSLPQDSKTCFKFAIQDAFDISKLGDFRHLLDGAFLVPLKQDEAHNLNADLATSLNQISQLVFFEFGIKIEGTSRFTSTTTETQMKALVKWKMIHERNEDEGLRLADNLETEFEMSRTYKESASDQIKIESRVKEFRADGSIPTVLIQYETLAGEDAKTSRYLNITKGFRAPSGAWTELSIDRKISLVFNRKDSLGWVLTLSDHSVQAKPMDLIFRYVENRQELCLISATSPNKTQKSSP